MLAAKKVGGVGRFFRACRLALSMLATLAVPIWPAGASGECIGAARDAARPAMQRLRDAMASDRFVTYQPTSLQVFNGRSTDADPTSIGADLRALRSRFDALITYGSRNGAEAIPPIAASLGYRAQVVGIWDPFDEREVDAAIAAARAQPALVLGLAVGNEWLFAGRPRAKELAARLASIHARAPEIPLATSEPFHVFHAPDAEALLLQADFLLPIVHPVFQPWFRDAPARNGAEFVVSVVDRLAERFCGPILVKETGVPTAPANKGFNTARQAAFYRELALMFPARRERAFAYFAAFDAPWRVADEQASPGVHPEEAHWGLFDAARVPKPVVAEVPALGPRP